MGAVAPEGSARFIMAVAPGFFQVAFKNIGALADFDASRRREGAALKAALETILDLHSPSRVADPRADWGVLGGNPVHEAIRRAAHASTQLATKQGTVRPRKRPRVARFNSAYDAAPKVPVVLASAQAAVDR